MNQIFFKILITAVFLVLNILANAQSNNSIYELSIQELESINIVPDSSSNLYMPTYEITIKDLMNLEIVKELRINDYIDVAYDIPLQELMQVKISIQKDTGIIPSYEMSLQGLTQLEIKEKTQIIDKIKLSYDISLDGIMNIEIRKN
mgnify:CR=1 FL=1